VILKDAGLGKHQKHAHDPEMHQYQHKISAPRHVHAAMHKLHLRASKANSLAAEEQMKLAHQVVPQLLQRFLARVTSLSVHKRRLCHVLNIICLFAQVVSFVLDEMKKGQVCHLTVPHSL